MGGLHSFLVGLSLLLLAAVEYTRGQDTKDNTVISITKYDDELICPTTNANLPLFSLSCHTNEDCKILGEQCCDVDGKMRCRKGMPKPRPIPTHAPFLGLFPRDCPTAPIPEFMSIKNCTVDSDCWPRICCPDGPLNYCRTPLPQWERTPRLEPLKNMVAYLQCTPPPPPLFDLFPKPCRSTLDCFPNLCCQERDKKVCRPPRKSMLALLATVTQRIGSG